MKTIDELLTGIEAEADTYFTERTRRNVVRLCAAVRVVQGYLRTETLLGIKGARLVEQEIHAILAGEADRG